MGASGPADPGQDRRFVTFDEANAVQRWMRQVAGTRGGAWLFSRLLHRIDLPVMRRTAGRRSVTAALSGLPMVELTTTGARTGLPRTMPIIGTPDADRLVLVASNYGAARHPGWYFNLKAHPRCTVVVRGLRYEMEAYEADGEERVRLWALDTSVYPARRGYAARTGGRRIPVMVLCPVQP
jgi:deazaflavin-dependent oxidoreductase (nitroreductase family)